MSADLLQGACHCGAVKFEVRTPIVPAGRCNCSLCRRKGALMTPLFPASQLKILSGEDSLTLYQHAGGPALFLQTLRCLYVSSDA
jgi:hypothetical protein